MNLINTWLAAEESLGHNQADAIRRMNSTLNCKYTSSRINEWRNGVRSPDSQAHQYLLWNSIVYAMTQADPLFAKHLPDPLGFAWSLSVALKLP